MNGYKTYIGIVIALIPTVVSLFGYSVSSDFSTQANVLSDDLITLLGLAIAFYGRSVASLPGLFVKKQNK